MLRLAPVSASAQSFSLHDRALALLLGLHGLALMVVFPFGPQASRLWHPGLPGVAVLASAFPLAVVLGGLLARRTPFLPASPRTLATLAFLGTLPCALSFDYPSLVAARLLAGFVAGISYVSIHRALPVSATPLVARLAPRLIAFGMPVCLLAATALDWRFAFVPILVGQTLLLLRLSRRAPKTQDPAPAAPPPSLAEAAPAALLATGALAFVSAAYLTVLSGFLVFNAGHTEWHIPAGLLLGALLGLAVPPAFAWLRARLAATAAYAAALGASALSLIPLLALRERVPAALAVGAIACFLAANAGRHLALAQLILPGIPSDALPSHQTHTHLAHHLGSGLGALAAGQLILLTPERTLAGMPALLAAAAGATGLALFAGHAAARKPLPPPQLRAIPSPAGISPSEMRAPS